MVVVGAMVVNILGEGNSVVMALGAIVVIVATVVVGCCELIADVKLSRDRGLRIAAKIPVVELRALLVGSQVVDDSGVM